MRRSKQESYQEIERLSKELLAQQANEAATGTHDTSNLIWRFWLSGVAVAVLGYFLFKSLNFIFVILSAFIISMAIENLIGFFQRRFSRPFSIGVAYFILIVFVLSGMIIVIPFVGQQLADIMASLVSKMYGFQQTLQSQ
ncbi:MAG: hypothetical protein H6765_07410 [Candidatus Peribacteria bacterium]|nr:MAG: hypothetical protein H6765_07410 [Candidatus Peribacteria bacterium]